MKCQRCKSERTMSVTCKCSDRFYAFMGEEGDKPDGREHDGYVPKDLGIGGGDYIDFEYCLDCGQIQGKFPLPPAKIEAGGA